MSKIVNLAELINLPSASVIVGNSSGIATGVALTGDVSITNTGVTGAKWNGQIYGGTYTTGTIASFLMYNSTSSDWRVVSSIPVGLASTITAVGTLTTGSIPYSLLTGTPTSLPTATSLILKADGGVTEGTDLYTFNGSVAKTINIVGGSNISITKSVGQWSIANTYSYTLPTATSTVLGGVKPDGTSIVNTAGVLSVTPASIGAVPTTTTVNGHALSSNITVTPTDLGLVIGTNVQAYHINLSSLSSLSYTSGTQFVKMTGTGTFALDGTAYSPLAGSASITTVGTLASGSIPYSLITGTPSLTGYVPYTGATGAVNLGTNTLQTGNQGLGTAPQWALANYNAIDINNYGLVYAGVGNFALASNAYHNGTNWVRKTADLATLYTMTSGQYQWLSAPTSTAGSTITSWTINAILNASGAFTLGSTSGTGTGALYAGTGNFTGALAGTSATFSGSNYSNSASKLYMDFSAGESRIYSFGANGTTNGTLGFYIKTSDGVYGARALGIDGTGAATFSSSIAASSFIKSGGTSSQYLMADGSTSTGASVVHLVGTGSAPTIAFNQGGTSTAFVTRATDLSGEFSVTGGTGSGSGSMVTITFNSAYATVPKVLISPQSAVAFGLNCYVCSISTTSFNVCNNNAIANGTTYSFNYIVAQ